MFIKILCICLLFISSHAYGLSDNYKETLKQNIWIIIERSPTYVWGGAESEAKGLDCSGYIYLAAKRSGIPVRRVTADMIAQGLGNWQVKAININEADELDIVWWTWLGSKRINGHIGWFIINRNKSKLLEVTHASSSKKRVVVEPLEGVLIRDISSVKRITIGDKQPIKLGPGVKQVIKEK